MLKSSIACTVTMGVGISEESGKWKFDDRKRTKLSVFNIHRRSATQEVGLHYINKNLEVARIPDEDFVLCMTHRNGATEVEVFLLKDLDDAVVTKDIGAPGMYLAVSTERDNIFDQVIEYANTCSDHTDRFFARGIEEQNIIQKLVMRHSIFEEPENGKQDVNLQYADCYITYGVEKEFEGGAWQVTTPTRRAKITVTADTDIWSEFASGFWYTTKDGEYVRISDDKVVVALTQKGGTGTIFEVFILQKNEDALVDPISGSAEIFLISRSKKESAYERIREYAANCINPFDFFSSGVMQMYQLQQG